ncbi:hypothetical protein P1J78_07865 [Psychromarinibacter sp. C21-152]|uniref:Uncharacterized protein n=1 Tax=Psychromarinibacter sediminicola TaxID=3033385 RepID=A0AAE3NRC6_9RHOB|nr:hypothetical protein [Psychromarinibacter sediminicola]MDF0600641.1 hypothetical protein [Psychromarinibacter sediminicola]
MTELSLVKTRIQGGIWEGVLTARGATVVEAPEIEVTHLGKPVDTVTVTPDPSAPGTWGVRIAIPPELLSDGVQTFLITAADSGETLDSFTIVTGEPLSDDIRGEVDLLRAELDLLKRAFRRHCVETM